MFKTASHHVRSIATAGLTTRRRLSPDSANSWQRSALRASLQLGLIFRFGRAQSFGRGIDRSLPLGFPLGFAPGVEHLTLHRCLGFLGGLGLELGRFGIFPRLNLGGFLILLGLLAIELVLLRLRCGGALRFFLPRLVGSLRITLSLFACGLLELTMLLRQFGDIGVGLLRDRAR